MRTVTGVCVRSRARWVCLVSFFTHIGHVAEAHEVRTALSLSLFHLFLSSLDWHFKSQQRRGENGESIPRTPLRDRRRHVAADKLITIRTIDRPLSLDPRRQQIREREERLPLPPLGQSNYHIEPTRLSPISFLLSPSRFFVFLSRITVN